MKPVFLLLFLITSVVAGADDRSLAGQKKTAEMGGVSVSVVPLSLAENGTGLIDFQLALDTHMGALPSTMLGFAKLIMEGGTEIAPVAWSGGKGGHHLSGMLSFPASETGKNGSLTLVLKSVDGRNDVRFEWKIPSKSAGNFTEGAR